MLEYTVRLGRVRLMVHTGGAGRETEVLWKQLNIRSGGLSENLNVTRR